MATDSERVRQFLGEVIPSGGSENDTMFTNVQIEDLLIQADGDVDAAVLSGWRQKAAEFAELVDVQEGTSKRAMSDLHKNALAMVTALGGAAGSGLSSSAGTKIHKIERS
jgi:hypothetical protein